MDSLLFQTCLWAHLTHHPHLPLRIIFAGTVSLGEGMGDTWGQDFGLAFLPPGSEEEEEEGLLSMPSTCKAWPAGNLSGGIEPPPGSLWGRQTVAFLPLPSPKTKRATGYLPPCFAFFPCLSMAASPTLLPPPCAYNHHLLSLFSHLPPMCFPGSCHLPPVNQWWV